MTKIEQTVNLMKEENTFKRYQEGDHTYKDFSKQPQITVDFLVSSNHVYAFALLSFLAFINYYKNQKIIVIGYLFFISIFLELSHFYIPNRGFQFSDLFGNIIGVLISLSVFNLIINWRKK